MSTGSQFSLSSLKTLFFSLEHPQKLRKLANLPSEDVYSSTKDRSQYEEFIPEEESLRNEEKPPKKSRFQYTAPQKLLDTDMKSGPEEEIFESTSRKIADREDKYLQRKKLRQISPERHDFFKDADRTPDINSRTYQDIMAEQKLENERQEVLRKIAKQKEEQQRKLNEKKPMEPMRFKPAGEKPTKFSQDTGEGVAKAQNKSSSVSTNISKSDWDSMAGNEKERVGSSKWDTPSRGGMEDATPSRKHRWDMTPLGEHDATPGRMLIGETPTPGRFIDPTPGRFGETPTPKRGVKSRWDDKTPLIGGQTPTNFIGLTPSMTPGMSTPGLTSLTPERLQLLRWEKEIDERNRPLNDEELDQLLPIEGYEVIFFWGFF